MTTAITNTPAELLAKASAELELGHYQQGAAFAYQAAFQAVAVAAARDNYPCADAQDAQNYLVTLDPLTNEINAAIAEQNKRSVTMMNALSQQNMITFAPPPQVMISSPLYTEFFGIAVSFKSKRIPPQRCKPQRQTATGGPANTTPNCHRSSAATSSATRPCPPAPRTPSASFHTNEPSTPNRNRRCSGNPIRPPHHGKRTSKTVPALRAIIITRRFRPPDFR